MDYYRKPLSDQEIYTALHGISDEQAVRIVTLEGTQTRLGHSRLLFSRFIYSRLEVGALFALRGRSVSPVPRCNAGSRLRSFTVPLTAINSTDILEPRQKAQEESKKAPQEVVLALKLAIAAKLLTAYKVHRANYSKVVKKTPRAAICTNMSAQVHCQLRF